MASCNHHCPRGITVDESQGNVINGQWTVEVFPWKPLYVHVTTNCHKQNYIIGGMRTPETDTPHVHVHAHDVHAYIYMHMYMQLELWIRKACIFPTHKLLAVAPVFKPTQQIR